jgi:hypothetical protein
LRDEASVARERDLRDAGSVASVRRAGVDDRRMRAEVVRSMVSCGGWE